VNVGGVHRLHGCWGGAGAAEQAAVLTVIGAEAGPEPPSVVARTRTCHWPGGTLEITAAGLEVRATVVYDEEPGGAPSTT
jgi:hypothetical protein